VTLRAWEPSAAGPQAAAPDRGAALETEARRSLARAFFLDRVLGRDPDSVTFAAREASAGRRVRLRVFRRPPVERGLNEELRALLSRITADHPHIVPVYDARTTDGLVWYSAKLVEGRPLSAILAERRTLDLAATLRLAEQVGNALAYSHRRGVVHGDLRPANVVVLNDWALVSDLAVGRVLERHGARPAPTDPRAAAYRAPETTGASEPTAAADQYALAAIVYECLTGAPPVATQSLSPPSRLPGPSAAALQRALRPRPALRYPSVLEFVTALARPEAPPPVLAPSRPQAANSGQRVLLVNQEPRFTRRTVMVAILGLVSIGGLAVLAAPNPQRRAAAPPAPRVAVAPPPPARARTPAPTPAPTMLPPLPPIERRAPAPVPARPGPSAPPASGGAPAVQGQGRLYISSMPWGRLFIDGQPAGTTPKEGLVLGAGAHRVEIVRDGYHPFRLEIHVGAAQDVRLTNIVLEAITP
jgi:serine/threonine-protein kinase